MTRKLGVALVGCGYIADAYRHCHQYHSSSLQFVGAFDHDPQRLKAYQAVWGDKGYASLPELLDDAAIDIIINGTGPESHATVTGAAIAAGKHVYSEKPMAMTYDAAVALRNQAAAAGVRLAAAPCNILGESAQTAWLAVRAGRIGRVRLVYAELDDGMIHRAQYRQWLSRSGHAWPARNEFATGCTFEHAGYALTVLAAMFGPVRRITAFSSLLIRDKQTDPPLPDPAPDFSTGLLEFDGGIVARLTNSVVAPYDHRMRIIGDEGTLEMAEPWDYACPVRFRGVAQGRLARFIERRFGAIGGKVVPAVRPPAFRSGRGQPTMDFMRGVGELADAIRSGRQCRLDADFAVHITEVTEILQHPERFACPAIVRSTFKPIAPMEWAA